MALGGGSFTGQNKVLPGAYINFVSTAASAVMGQRGTAALALELDWGPEGALFTLESGTADSLAPSLLGYQLSDPAVLAVHEAVKRAEKLLLYRVNGGGVKASSTVGGLEAEALYSGTRGNSLKVAVLEGEEGMVEVVTYLDGQAVDSQTVSAAGGGGALTANGFVAFSGGESLTPTAATPLTGGTNGTGASQGYTDWLAALETASFQTLGYPGDDESVKEQVCRFVDRMRQEEGKKITGVVYNYPQADSMGILSVKNGVVLSDGTTVPGQTAVAWVAGATAAAQVNESLTNDTYDGAVDVDVRYTKSQYEAAVEGGEFVFYADGSAARVLCDINTLTTFGGGVSRDWTSNQVVRVMDGWANDVAAAFSQSYLGRQINSATGRALFKADLIALAAQYEALDAIGEFSADDITVEQGSDKGDVVVTCLLQPNDSMEKLYMTVTVQ